MKSAELTDEQAKNFSPLVVLDIVRFLMYR